ncbi:MAG TPA: sensor domain-containing diguanylate cyclase [Kofleriaceae bacterium]|nr:sensor domain-containing diguanylate cyclase [Kofleriaceae bacterium]
MSSSPPGQARLLAIIELQNAIAAAAMNADEVMRIVAERARLLTAAATSMVALVDGEDLVYRAITGPSSHEEGARVARASSLAGRSVAERKALRIDRAAEDPLASADATGARAASPGSVLCVPLLYGEIAVGALEVISPRAAAFTDEDIETLRMLGQIVAIALHRAYTYPRPRYDSLQDALTGLGNRRAFDERLEAELNRNRRFRHSFSLGVVKLDGLETAIDRLGPTTGDELLRKLAGILKAHTRMIDGCFRIRADELAIVMPGTSLEGARVVAERCRAASVDSGLYDGAVRLGFGVVAASAEEFGAEIIARVNAALDYGAPASAPARPA